MQTDKPIPVDRSNYKFPPPGYERRYGDSGFTHSELLGWRNTPSDTRRGGMVGHPTIMLLRAIFADQRARYFALNCTRRDLPKIPRGQVFSLPNHFAEDQDGWYERLFEDGYIDADDRLTGAGFDLATDIDSAEEDDGRDAGRTKEDAEAAAAKRAKCDADSATLDDAIIALLALNPGASNRELVAALATQGVESSEPTVRRHRKRVAERQAAKTAPNARPGESME